MAELQNRVIEMVVYDLQKKLRELPPDGSFATQKLTAFGIDSCFLEFHPNGNFWCTKPGYCSLVFCCPANVRLKLKMYCGPVTVDEPQELLVNSDANEKLYGLHDFCEFRAATDESEDALVCGVEIVGDIVWENQGEKESDKVVRVTLD